MVVRYLKGILIISSILFCLVSCGYHFSGEGQGPKPGLKCIAIPVFDNKTSEPDAGAIFAGALRQEFMRKGAMKVVPVDQAEAVFIATIKDIQTQAVAHEPVANVVANRVTVETRLVVVLDVRCEEKQTHKILWRDAGFTYWKVYQVEDNPLQPNPITGFENRQAALGFLAREMAIRVHDRFLSNF